MQNRLYKHTKSILPFILFSILAGFLSAVAGTAFKLGAEWVIHLSATLYGTVRQNALLLPVLILGAAALGLAASFIVSLVKSCKGGGIPTSVAAVRGIVSFKWLPSVLVLPFSALITFFCGIPLGTEGPCVQMGTAIGEGVMRCLGSKKHQAWRRYVMTGGASAGFSIATASPISAILFSIEELHKKFSPLLMAGASVAVMTAQITAQILALFGIGSSRLFHLPEIDMLSVKLMFAPLLVGVICGVGSTLFTRFYHAIEKTVHKVLEKVSVKIAFPVLFAFTSIVGVCLSDTLGTGHALVEKLFHAHTAWYMLILVFLIRMIIMMVSNTAGVTGGVFLPTIAFGAVIGSLCADGMIALGVLQPNHYVLMVVLGISAFLGATSRIPITACVFAVEALGGVNNILAVVIATTVAFMIAKYSEVEDFTDAVIEAKERSIRKGAKPQVVVASLTVGESSFVVGKSLCDILLPNDCAVVSVDRARECHNNEGLQAGDVITVRYKTYSPVVTAEELNVLVGNQPE